MTKYYVISSHDIQRVRDTISRLPYNQVEVIVEVLGALRPLDLALELNRGSTAQSQPELAPVTDPSQIDLPLRINLGEKKKGRPPLTPLTPAEAEKLAEEGAKD